MPASSIAIKASPSSEGTGKAIYLRDPGVSREITAGPHAWRPPERFKPHQDRSSFIVSLGRGSISVFREVPSRDLYHRQSIRHES